jgi:hypothetical protein
MMGRACRTYGREMRNKALIAKHEEKRLLGRHRWEDNNRKDLKKEDEMV